MSKVKNRSIDMLKEKSEPIFTNGFLITKCQSVQKDDEDYLVKFARIDLIALYTTMALKQVVDTRSVWKKFLDDLVEEVKGNMKVIGEEKMQYLFFTLREFSRIYADPWGCDEHGIEVGQPIYESLLVVVLLRLGMKLLWSPFCATFKEDILYDNFFSQKPSLNLKVISQMEPFYDVLIPLCKNLVHVLIPMANNEAFIKATKIKSLMRIDFSSGVSDKVMCQALWNVDKKSEKLLQMIVKERKDGNYVPNINLPHLEMLQSNVLNKRETTSGMKLTFGAVALLLQKKMKSVENQCHWGTFEALKCIMDMESKLNVKIKKSLMCVDQLRIQPCCDEKRNIDCLKRAYAMCPKINSLTFTHYNIKMNPLSSFLKCIPPRNIEHLALDISYLSSEAEFFSIMEPYVKLKSLTLKVSLKFLSKFRISLCYDVGKDIFISGKSFYPDLDKFNIKLPYLKKLSLVMSQDRIDDSDAVSKMDGANSIMSFLSRFSNIDELHYYNVLDLNAPFVIYGLIGGAMAVMDELKVLSIVGNNKYFPCEYSKSCSENEIQELSTRLPELLEDSTFNQLKNLKVFIIDEFCMNKSADKLLEALRAADVLVKVIYRPSYYRNIIPMDASCPNNHVDCCKVDVMELDLEDHYYSLYCD